MKKKNIKFSLVAPAIRIENWLKVYDSMKSENTNFEVIFAGPRKPNFKLPSNFRFIFTTVKPAQCWEILYENSNGEYIINFSDDVIFQTENPLDELSKELELYKNKKVLIGLRYKFRDIDQTNQMSFKINNNQDETELLPMDPPIKKTLWYKYGRFDRRFICTLLEADFFLRMIKDGYRVVHANIYISEEKKLEDDRKMSRDYLRVDRKLMMKLWTKKINGKYIFSQKRNEPVKNFETKNILTHSQKPYGRWSNSNMIYNFFITSRIFYKLNLYFHLRSYLYKIKTLLNK